MFSYCNRNNRSATNTNIYDYSINNLKLPIHKPVFLCDGSYQQQILNRGIPKNLVDLNSHLRGHVQKDNCFNDSNDIQFSSIRPLPAFNKDNSKIPCMNLISYKNDSNKVTYLNKTRPIYGHPDLKYSEGEKF